jgi:pantoate--beta-alanine ligase
MQVVRTVRELQAIADRDRAEGRRIALVPTMGALHAGHLAIVDEARKRADRVVVSIFVNPTQFNDPSDYDAYPATFEADSRKCADAGVDVVFNPTPVEMYPEGGQTWVEVSELAKPLCGASRPGHFRGVTTVVCKLLLAARPHCALFGEKDYQQLAVIRRMAEDLRCGVEIVGVPTVRESDGLALSSRNVHLCPEGRRQALALVAALDAAEAMFSAGETSREEILDRVIRELDQAALGEVEYAELRDPVTLALAPEQLHADSLLALAVFFRITTAPEDASREAGRVRLIDNRVLRWDPELQGMRRSSQ